MESEKILLDFFTAEELAEIKKLMPGKKSVRELANSYSAKLKETLEKRLEARFPKILVSDALKKLEKLSEEVK